MEDDVRYAASYRCAEGELQEDYGWCKMKLLQQSLIAIFGIVITITLSAMAVTTKLTVFIVTSIIVAFALGAYISELGAKGKEMGVIK